MNLLYQITGAKKAAPAPGALLEKAAAQQEKTLRKLLKKARRTEFGRAHGFGELRREPRELAGLFQKAVGLHTYPSMKNWWDEALAGRPDVCWPGQVPFWATSSGTSEGRQKFAPVTREGMRSIYRGGTRQFLAMRGCGLPASHFAKKILCISSSSELRWNGAAAEGYISGITASGMPKWFEFYHRPGRRINALDWEEKVAEIVRNAPRWDVGSLVGLPNWTQIILEKIIEAHGLSTIHDLWPNLRVVQHSGMAFGPYRSHFERLLARPVLRFETYFASEGFFAYSDRPRLEEAPGAARQGMRLLTGNGAYFEFVPFDETCFAPDGSPLDCAKSLTINELEEKRPYALAISTNTGAWRYLLGDVVRFTDLARLELEVVGRTTTFLNLCGEHLTEANLNAAVGWANDRLGAGIREFCIAPGRAAGGGFAHHWFIGCEGAACPVFLMEKLDGRLRELNEYYDFERSVSLREVRATVVPPAIFKKWLAQKAASQPQQKFPRVLSGKNLELWRAVLAEGTAAVAG